MNSFKEFAFVYILGAEGITAEGRGGSGVGLDLYGVASGTCRKSLSLDWFSVAFVFILSGGFETTAGVLFFSDSTVAGGHESSVKTAGLFELISVKDGNGAGVRALLSRRQH